jgi:hypothetical protein
MDRNKFPPPPYNFVTLRNLYAANEYHFNNLLAVSTGELRMFSEFYLRCFHSEYRIDT